MLIRVDGNHKRTIIAGKVGENGFRDGDFSNTLFNEPSGVIYFRKNLKEAGLEARKKTIILKSVTSECKHATLRNYTSCEDSRDDFKDNENYVEYDQIDPTLILDVYEEADSEADTYD